MARTPSGLLRTSADQSFDLFGGGGFAVVGLAEFDAFGEELLVSVLNSNSVKSARAASGSGGCASIFDGIEVHRDVGLDGDELFAEQHHVAIVLQRLAIGLALDFGGALERGFDGAEALDELDRALVADAGSAGNVVDGVAAQGHDVDDALGRHAEDFLRPWRDRK